MIHQFLNLFAVYKIKKKTQLPTGLQFIIMLFLCCRALWWLFLNLTKLHLDQGSSQWDVHSLDSILTLLHGRENEKAAPLISFVWAFASPVPFSWFMKRDWTAVDYEAKIKYMRTTNQLCRQTQIWEASWGLGSCSCWHQLLGSEAWWSCQEGKWVRRASLDALGECERVSCYHRNVLSDSKNLAWFWTIVEIQSVSWQQKFRLPLALYLSHLISVSLDIFL